MKSNVTYFLEKIKDDKMDKKLQFHYKYLVSIYANIPISQNTLVERFVQGYKCPFLGFTQSEYEFLLNLSYRILIDPQLLIDCTVTLSQKYNKSISDCIKDFFNYKNTELALQMYDDKIFLYEGNAVKGMYSTDELKKLQVQILFG